MSRVLTLQCGCVVCILSDEHTGITEKRVLEARGSECHIRGHEVGVRVYLWDLLPPKRSARCSTPAQNGSAPTERWS
jgi:hypothetical protein